MEKKVTNRMILITAVILVLVGAVLLFVPQIRLQHIVYFLCGVIVAGGICCIVRYFMSNGFREASDYGFSVGVFLCVIGIAGFIKSREIVAFFPVAISLMALLFGVILLQDALDLKRLLCRSWILILVFAAVVILTSMIVLVNPFTGLALRQNVGNDLMFGTGILVLISKLVLAGSYKGYEKREQKQSEAIEEPIKPEETEKKELKEEEVLEREVIVSEEQE
ncbi:MAG: DUF308 domain-containing protein [Lachnospiraceae bacterium]